MLSEGKELAEITFKKISHLLHDESQLSFIQAEILKSYNTLSKAQKIIFAVELEDRVFDLKNKEEEEQIKKWKQIVLKDQYPTSETLVHWLRNLNTKDKERNTKQNYSMIQIAIAYHAMGITITEENAAEILKKHSDFTSAKKLVQKRINNERNVTNISGNKMTDTNRRKNLMAAERLVKGTKNGKAIEKMKCYSTEFNDKYEKKYC